MTVERCLFDCCRHRTQVVVAVAAVEHQLCFILVCVIAVDCQLLCLISVVIIVVCLVAVGCCWMLLLVVDWRVFDCCCHQTPIVFLCCQLLCVRLLRVCCIVVCLLVVDCCVCLLLIVVCLLAVDCVRLLLGCQTHYQQ